MKPGTPQSPSQTSALEPASRQPAACLPLFNGFAEEQPPGSHLDSGLLVFSSSDDNNSFSLQHINQTACRQCGVRADLLLGQPLEQICHANRLERVAALFHQVLASRIPAGFTLGTSLTGSIIPLSGHQVLLIIEEGRTDDRIVEAISRGKHEWEQTVDAIDDIITIMDPDLRIIRANRAAHHLFGYEFGELVGRPCYEVFQNRPDACPKCPVTLPANGRQKTHRGLVHNRLLNKTFDLSSTKISDRENRLQMIVHTARDVTASIRQEEERKRLSTAIEQTSEMVVITDVRGTIRYVNPAFTDTTGFTREEAVGRNMNLLKSGHHDDAFYRQLWETILAGRVWKGRLINRTKDGALFSEMTTISPIVDGDRTVSAFVAVKRDISREEELEKQLRQAVKLEAIGTLAGGIAHDFNNILAAILGYAQIAKGQLEEGDPLTYPLDHILAAGDRAADLIGQILTFSRSGAGARTAQPAEGPIGHQGGVETASLLVPVDHQTDLPNRR